MFRILCIRIVRRGLESHIEGRTLLITRARSSELVPLRVMHDSSASEPYSYGDGFNVAEDRESEARGRYGLDRALTLAIPSSLLQSLFWHLTFCSRNRWESLQQLAQGPQESQIFVTTLSAFSWLGFGGSITADMSVTYKLLTTFWGG